MGATSIPKGTRDFSPKEMSRRNYIFSVIRDVFRLYGYSQIETPAMETLATLMGKYGEEGDKLLFKVLNSGDYLRKVADGELSSRDALHLATKICEKGLRYDLTVPFARYVVMHRDELQMPFKRFQIQPVWRADRPQRGRYREFYQCDADVVGSTSLLNEAELIQIFDEVFARLGIRVVIKINNRKILSGIAEYVGASEKIVEITTAVDKIEKIGIDNVKKEMLAGGMTEAQIAAVEPILLLSGSNDDKLSQLGLLLKASETGQKGIEETRRILSLASICGARNAIEFDLTLARGLNYYTGAIFEVKALDCPMGSISGGGRYDNLTGIFGMPGLSGVGISFGADRIYDVLAALELFPEQAEDVTTLLFANFGEQEVAHALTIAATCRRAGVRTEVYPEACKMKKQMAYANAKGIPYVAIVGQDEIAEGVVTLKNMLTGEQKKVHGEELLRECRQKSCR